MNRLRHSRAQMQKRIDKLKRQVKGQLKTMAERDEAQEKRIAYLTERTADLAGQLEQAKQAGNGLFWKARAEEIAAKLGALQAAHECDCTARLEWAKQELQRTAERNAELQRFIERGRRW